MLERPMRVGFMDPQGPRRWRTAPYIVPIALFTLALFGPFEGTSSASLGLLAIATFNAIGLVNPMQRTPSTVKVVHGPGYVDVKAGVLRGQRIRAKDITGATTARTASGVLLTLQHRDRMSPITLELTSEAEAEEIRRALGIGHGGYGTVVWRTQGSSNHLAFVGRTLAAGTTLLTLLATLAISPEAGVVAASLLGMFGLVGTMLGIVGLSQANDPNVVMTAEGLRLRTPRGWFALPYGAINDIEDRDDNLFFRIPPPYHGVSVPHATRLIGGPSKSDRRIMVAQIKAAAQRAHGLGAQKNDVTGRLEVLRRHGESARDWLVRLDMAGQMLSSGSGYRGSTLDEEDLWTILEDPEAEPDLRAAAARVLRHVPNPRTRVRIDIAAAAVRDESTLRRLRIAVLDDLDIASEELTELDADEAMAPRRVVAREPTMQSG